MIERYFEKPDDIALIERWLTSSPEDRDELPAKLQDKLERLKRANRWLMAHNSRKNVWPMMHQYYTDLGRKYSESTARQDTVDAERLFLQLTPHTGPYITTRMIDSLFEEYHSALRRNDTTAAVKYAAQLDKYIERHDRYIEQLKNAARAPVPILAVFDLEEANIQADPTINKKIDEWRKSRDQRLAGQAPDVDFTEIPSDDDPSL